MSISTHLSKISTIAAAIGLVFASSTAASATTPRSIPDGERYYALPCAWMTSVQPANLNSFDDSAVTAGVGSTAFDGSTCLADGSYNVVDGYYYAYDWNASSYVKVDIRTGAQEFLGDLTVGGSPVGGSMNGTFVDQDGNHYLFMPAELYEINLDDMTMTLITDQLPLDSINYITSISYNPIDGAYYGLRSRGDVYEIDLSDGSTTLVGVISECDPSHTCWGLEFDSAGTMWVERDNEGGNSHVAGLYSTTLDDLDGNWVSQGAYTDSVLGGWYGESSFIAPDVFPWDVQNDSGVPLANTGFDALAPMGIAGLIAIAGGMIITRRRLLK
jgi:hypothetical protein